jgi:CRP-like cAMP-binding protein
VGTVLPPELPRLFPWLVQGLDDRDRAGLAASLVDRRLADGEVLLPAGAVLPPAAHALHLLVDGGLRISVPGPGGARVLGVEGPGDFVGEMAFVDPAPASAEVAAEGPARVLSLPRSALAGLRRAHPRLVGQLLSAVCCDLARRIRGRSLPEAAPGGGGDVGLRHLAALHGVGRREPPCCHLPTAMRDLTSERAYRIPTWDEFRGLFPTPPGGEALDVRRVEADLRQAAQWMLVRDLPRGHVLLEAGSRMDGWVGLLGGEVDVVEEPVVRPGALGLPRRDRVMGEGSLLGVVAHFDDGVRTSTVTARTDVRALFVYPIAVSGLLRTGERGAMLGLHVLEAAARQLARDARSFNERLVG